MSALAEISPARTAPPAPFQEMQHMATAFGHVPVFR